MSSTMFRKEKTSKIVCALLGPKNKISSFASSARRCISAVYSMNSTEYIGRSQFIFPVSRADGDDRDGDGDVDFFSYFLLLNINCLPLNHFGCYYNSTFENEAMEHHRRMRFFYIHRASERDKQWFRYIIYAQMCVCGFSRFTFI